MRSALHAGQDLALLIARVALGITLGAHGWYRWVTGVDSQITSFKSGGIPNPVLIAWSIIIIELIGGILLVFGLGTRIIGLIVVAQNTLAILWLHWPNGLFATNDGFELNLMIASLSLLLVAFGSGRLSVDGLFVAPSRPKTQLARTTN